MRLELEIRRAQWVAAIRVQLFWRRVAARLEFLRRWEEMLRKHRADAATRLQRLFRGHYARLYFQEVVRPPSGWGGGCGVWLRTTIRRLRDGEEPGGVLR